MLPPSHNLDRPADPGPSGSRPSPEATDPLPLADSAPVKPPRGAGPPRPTTGLVATGSTAIRPGRDRTSPPTRRAGLLAWLALGACLVLAAIPMLVDLHRPELDSAEAVAVATSVETWRRRSELGTGSGRLEPWIPHLNGEPQLEAPPGATWLHLLAMGPLLPDSAAIDALILHARLVSVLFGLLTVAAVFWAGLSIGSLVTASLAALVCLANPVLLHQSRLATNAMPQLGLAMLSIAAALWATRPLKPAPSLIRQAIGWAVCGLALGLTVLTGGPAAGPLVLVPLLLILLLCPHRIAHLIGLIASVFIAGLLITPWSLYVHEQNPGAWRLWLSELVPPWHDVAAYGRLTGSRLLLIAAAVLPWTVWLMGGFVQPLSTSSAGARQRMFIGWVWLLSVTVLLLLSPSGRGKLDVVMPALPVAAILIGQLFRQFSDLSAQGRHARFWRKGRWIHLALLGAASVAIPVAFYFRSAPPADPTQTPVAPMHGLFWAGLAVVLLGLTGLSLRSALRHYPARALAWWALWTVVGFTVLVIPWARGPRVRSNVKDEARQLAHILGDSPALWLAVDKADTSPTHAGLLLYAGQTIRQVRPDQFDPTAGQPSFLLAPKGHPPRGSWQAVRDLDLSASGLRLWKPFAADSAHRPDSADPAADTMPDNPPDP